MSKQGVLVAVLAGGRGSRLGGEKPLAELAGRPLIEHVLDAARGTGLPVAVVAKRGTALPPLGVEVLLEPDEPRHPLTGILAALGTLRAGDPAAAVLAVGCDTPLLSAALLSALAACEGAAALGAPGRLHPLPARIPRSALAELERRLAARGPLREAIAALSPRLIGPAEAAAFGDPARLLFNVNDPDGLRAAESLLSPGEGRSARPPR